MKKHTNGLGPQTAFFKQESDPKESNSVFELLIPEIQRALAIQGYVNPTPIQEQCIQHLLKGRDLLGTAQTGTGKTAAFTLPLLQKLSRAKNYPKKYTPRALILAPTRELALQIEKSLQTYGQFLPLRHAAIFGGVSQFHQVKALKRGVDILVATPGRLLDLMQQRFVNLSQLEVFILDEVDRMLDMGFIADIRRILRHIPTERQTLFFSATLAPKMRALAQTMVFNPVEVAITPDKPAVERITQKILFVKKENKDALLLTLLRNASINKAIIFTQMKHVANRVLKKLSAAGIKGTAIHGNKSQAARTQALEGFRQSRFRFLVATDVAARGLDVDDITHVINYDLPVESNTYVHRIGRTARAGLKGDAISFCCAEDRGYLIDIEGLLGKAIPQDVEHAYHCEKAFNSNQSSPKNIGRSSNSNHRCGRRQQGKFSRLRGRRK